MDKKEDKIIKLKAELFDLDARRAELTRVIKLKLIELNRLVKDGKETPAT
jgi:hypothetical protein